MKKSLLLIIYIIAIFLMVDSCYIVLVPKDKWMAALEAALAGFLIFGIVIHHSMMNEKIIN